MSGKIQRISSRQHKVGYELSQNQKQAKIYLDANERFNQNKDFILYFRDDKINEPTAIASINQHGEQCILVNILPELKAPRIKDRTLKALKESQQNKLIDNDATFTYEPKLDD